MIGHATFPTYILRHVAYDLLLKGQFQLYMKKDPTCASANVCPSGQYYSHYFLLHRWQYYRIVVSIVGGIIMAIFWPIRGSNIIALFLSIDGSIKVGQFLSSGGSIIAIILFCHFLWYFCIFAAPGYATYVPGLTFSPQMRRPPWTHFLAPEHGTSRPAPV